ncbi:MAG: hypothetical protein WCJ30_27460 [Deltaproteobacteria bacterium]
MIAARLTLCVSLFACVHVALVSTTQAQPSAAQPAVTAPSSTDRARPMAPPGPGAAQAPPASVTNAGGAEPTARTVLSVGQAVGVEWQGSWYAGHVVALHGDRVRIHYDGYDASTDETVARRRLRVGASFPAPPMRPAQVEPTGTPVSVYTGLAAGLPVQVNHHGQWWAAHITAVLPDGQVAVRYDSYEPSADEIVSRDRLLLAVPAGQAPPPAAMSTGQSVDAQTPLAIGDALHIEWSGSLYPGRVVALLADGGVRVHYLGWGGDSDENVARTRLRVRIPRPVIVPVAQHP